eukprot:1679283-Pyramimonas_sp.AAC.2
MDMVSTSSHEESEERGADCERAAPKYPRNAHISDDDDDDDDDDDSPLAEDSAQSSGSDAAERARCIVAGSSSDIKGRELDVSCGGLRGVLIPGARRGEECIRMSNREAGRVVPAIDFVKMAGKHGQWADVVKGLSETGERCSVGQMLKEQVGCLPPRVTRLPHPSSCPRPSLDPLHK